MNEAARGLLEHGLKDMYDAEQRFLVALGKMTANASDESLKSGFKRHRDITEHQVERLEDAFADLGMEPAREACDGAKGLITEYERFIEEQSYGSGTLDAFAASAGLKVEHYEIASYRSLIDLAQFCNFTKAARLLKQNLAEEEEAAAEMQSAATTLGAQLADASTAEVAGRAIGSAIDHMRETTVANIGGARAVGKRAVSGAKKAVKSAEARGRSVRNTKTSAKTKSSGSKGRATTAKRATSRSASRSSASATRKKKPAPRSKSGSRSRSR